MKRLKELRQSYGYTQAQLAEMLQTTQQTVARWESGKAEPSVQALRDLAVIFGTSVDDLLGTNPLSGHISSNHYIYSLGADSEGGFWGHLGLLLPGFEHIKWYPITLRTANAITSVLTNAAEESWIAAPTLNNRLLMFNPTQLRQICLLDDACDEPKDWVLGWDNYAGLSLELYQGLEEYVISDGTLEENASEAFRSTVEDIVKENDLDEDAVLRATRLTAVHVGDGGCTENEVDGDCLWELMADVEAVMVRGVLRLTNIDEGSIKYFPAKAVSLIDAPLLKVMEAAKREYNQLVAELED